MHQSTSRRRCEGCSDPTRNSRVVGLRLELPNCWSLTTQASTYVVDLDRMVIGHTPRAHHGADITPSLVAKMALAWRVFSGAIIPAITG